MHARELRGRVQYRSRFPSKSSELASARRREPSNSFAFPDLPPRSPPIALITMNGASREAVPHAADALFEAGTLPSRRAFGVNDACASATASLVPRKTPISGRVERRWETLVA